MWHLKSNTTTPPPNDETRQISPNTSNISKHVKYLHHDNMSDVTSHVTTHVTSHVTTLIHGQCSMSETCCYGGAQTWCHGGDIWRVSWHVMLYISTMTPRVLMVEIFDIFDVFHDMRCQISPPWHHVYVSWNPSNITCHETRQTSHMKHVIFQKKMSHMLWKKNVVKCDVFHVRHLTCLMTCDVSWHEMWVVTWHMRCELSHDMLSSHVTTRSQHVWCHTSCVTSHVTTRLKSSFRKISPHALALI